MTVVISCGKGLVIEANAGPEQRSKLGIVAIVERAARRSYRKLSCGARLENERTVVERQEQRSMLPRLAFIAVFCRLLVIIIINDEKESSSSAFSRILWTHVLFSNLLLVISKHSTLLLVLYVG